MAKKRVIIVGTGPTGMFAALELSKNPNLEILMFDSGPDRKTRTENNLTSGWGGAGAFSDGKLTLPHSNYPQSLKVGGQLSSIIGKEKFLETIGRVNQIYSEFGNRLGDKKKLENHDIIKEQQIQKLVDKASIFGLRLTPTVVHHFGSDLSPEIARSIKMELEHHQVQIYLETPVKSVRSKNSGFLVKTIGKYASEYNGDYVIVAPGRDGADWLAQEAEVIGIEIEPRTTSVDIGVRVETLQHVLSPLTDYLYDPKIEFYPKPFEDKVRTFCACPYGEVLIEKYRNKLVTVNGHSLYEKQLSRNINFAILVSVNFTEPFKEPLKYAARISELANMLGGKVLIQRLGDLKAGRRSVPAKINRGLVEPTLKEATPGDLSFALPHRFLTSILGMIEALDKIAPGVNGDDTLLYGNEVKFYSSRIKTTSEIGRAHV